MKNPMKTVLLRTALAVALLWALVVLAGVVRFNLTDDDLFVVLKDGRVVPLDQAPRPGAGRGD